MLDLLGATVEIAIGQGRCEACLDEKTTVSLRSSDPKPPLTGATSLHEAVWQFLERRRGEMFCTACLMQALGATKRIEKALMTVEGRGAQRRHARCSACGKDRLLCGLTSNGV